MFRRPKSLCSLHVVGVVGNPPVARLAVVVRVVVTRAYVGRYNAEEGREEEDDADDTGEGWVSTPSREVQGCRLVRTVSFGMDVS